jgi:hypothetical protein
MAIVALVAVDSGEHGDVTLTDRSASPTWSFRAPQPGRHGYRYTLTLVFKDGTRRVQPSVDGSLEILVLHPEE